MQFISNSEQEKKEILSAIGVKNFEELISNIPPGSFFSPSSAGGLKNGLSEMEVLSQLNSLASKNQTVEELISFLGAGTYHHFIPSAVNALISRGEFLTAYTPYQPEASQGTLQSAFEFQSMICELYGMDVANASLYDGASALAEAALLALRETGRKKVLISKTVHPEYRAVLKTYCKSFLSPEPSDSPLERSVSSATRPRGVGGRQADGACGEGGIIEIPYSQGITSLSELEKLCDSQTACVIIQNPNFFGCIEEGEKFAELAHKNGALFLVSANPISLGLLTPPGEYGADIAVGEGQSLGIPLNFGGPYLGLFACKEKFMRKVPGRIVGMTKDLEGKRGFVLTLQAREQHIRREKATSNICTNEALMALAATVYLSLLGPKGLKEVAELCLQKAHYLASEISKIPGFSLAFTPRSHCEENSDEAISSFFNEFVVRSKIAPEKIQEHLLKNNIIGGLPLGRFYPELSDATLFCATEMNSNIQNDSLVHALKEIGS